jgi:glycosyltransferase involved in cell wall biosynthesis
MSFAARSEKLTVCMATYNGSRYVHEQIASILPQLQQSDELIVVDDCSTDETAKEIQTFRDTRVRFVQSDSNFGVIPSFERALRMAKGDIIFLSDQDDVWREDKVRKMLEAFDSDPRVTLVISAVELTDISGNQTVQAAPTRSRFRGGVMGTLVKNNYQGCAMAFRRVVVDAALPFPPSIPMHDSWIGLVNAFVGKTMFLDVPLVRYRRHDQNASGGRRLSVYQQIVNRWSLSMNLIRRGWLLARR